MSIFSCEPLKIFYTGSSYRLDFQILDGASDLPKDISTFTDGNYIIQASERTEDIPLVLKTLADGMEIIDGPNGLVRVTLLKDDTTLLYQGTLQHEASLWDAEGNSAVILSERISVVNANSTKQVT